MKVAHIITGLAADGAETMLYKLLERTDRARFESIVVSLTPGGALAPVIRALGVPVLEPAPRSFARLLRWRPDVLQGWMYHGNLAAQALSAVLPARTPVIWNVRGSHHVLRDEKIGTALAIRLSGRLSRLPFRIVNNSAASALLHEQYNGFAADRWEIIPNGFDLERFAPSPDARRDLRSELRAPENALLVGLIGRYHPMKDHANFIAAAGRLALSAPQTHFVLAGSHVDSKNSTLVDQIRAAGIAPRTHLLGARTDMPRVAAALDIAVSASFSEGFPNVVGEAMCCGVPCVVTDVGDSAWLVGDGGLVVPPRNAELLAEALRDLLDRGSEARRNLGRVGRGRIFDHFSISAVACLYEKLYQRAFDIKESEDYKQCAA